MLGIQYPRSLARFLYAQRVRGLTAPDAPQFDEPSAERFAKELQSSEFYLEFGSGGSTLMADRMGKHGLSVENDRFFSDVIRRAFTNNTMELIEVSIGVTREWGRPLFTRPTPARVDCWARYSTAPFPLLKERDLFPDFVLIDGRFRRACALNTAHHAAEAGRRVTIMFDDYYNIGRHRFNEVEQFLGLPERVGRAAFFHVSPASLRRKISDADLRAATADFE
jgi:hypothetical protein